LVRVPRSENDERGSLRKVAATIKIPAPSSFWEAQALDEGEESL
jgi:hypothetical protein